MEPTPLLTKRIPQSPEEQNELEEIATNGPVEVYKWIYGENSDKAREAASSNLTWNDFDVADSKAGLYKLLTDLRAEK